MNAKRLTNSKNNIRKSLYYECRPRIIYQTYKGMKNLSSLFWSLVIGLGGFCFILAGLSSFFRVNFLFLPGYNEIAFLPQGIVLTFYGSVGFLLGLFLMLTLYYDIGNGYNKFCGKTKTIRIYRKRFLGLNGNADIALEFKFLDVKSIKIQSQRAMQEACLFLCLGDAREIPFTPPCNIEKCSVQAIIISKIIGIPISSRKL